MLGERLFLLGLLLVALVAAIYAAPKAVKLSIGYGKHIGGPDDEGLEGSSLAAKLLARMGHRVLLEEEPGAATNYTSVVYFLPGPSDCSAKKLQALGAELDELLSRGARVAIIVADEEGCGPAIAGLLGVEPPVTYTVSPRDYIVFTRSGVLFALHTVLVTEAPRDWLVEGYTYPNALPGLLLYRSAAYTIAYIPDSHALSNAVLLAENETGISPLEELGYLLGLVGAGGNEPIIIPLYLYRQEYTAAQLAAQIHPGILVMEALSMLRSGEKRLISMLEAVPGALAAASLVIAAPMYLVMREALGTQEGGSWAEEEAKAPAPRLLEEIESLPRYRPAPLRLHRVARQLYSELLAAWRARHEWSLLEEEARPRILSPRELAALRRLSSLAGSRARCLLVARPRRLMEKLLEQLGPLIARLQEEAGKG